MIASLCAYDIWAVFVVEKPHRRSLADLFGGEKAHGGITFIYLVLCGGNRKKGHKPTRLISVVDRFKKFSLFK